MDRKEALIWAEKYISRKARKTHPDYTEFLRRTKYIVNKLFDEFENNTIGKENDSRNRTR